MIGLVSSLALALALAPQVTDLTPKDATSPAEGETGVVARMLAEPAEVEIGQPFDWVLAVEHPRDVSVEFAGESPLPDDSWVLLDERRLGGDLPGDEDMRLSLFRWTVISLEPGLRELPGLELRYDQDGAPRKAIATAGVVEVRPALLPEEDAPRPPLGFRPPPEDAERDGRALALGLGGAVLLAIIAAIVAMRRGARGGTGAAPSGPTPRERLNDVAQRARGDLEARATRDLHFELSSALRDHVETRLDSSADDALLEGLTDDEWIAALRRGSRLAPDAIDTLEALLSRVAPVKYGGPVPTRFAVEETLQELERCLVVLDRAGPNEPTAAAAKGGSR